MSFSIDGALCPYCDHLIKPEDDNWSLYDPDICGYTCTSCGEEFDVEVFTRYSWTTTAIEKDV